MAYWEINVPTVDAEQRKGVQTFTYSAERYPLQLLAKRQARKDVDSPEAIRHRRGATADTGAMSVVWHDTYQF
ncbi:hypothetical protein ABT368_31805 [Streptomyces althioticus]|nr:MULTISPECIES: hypothetical protein [unclassified Streptomyces]MYS50899.1 hypothetical protein [Streptomyces sp. SID6013]WTB51651.1 hypothetical protein OG968_35775 [Streptomyces althioticus]GGT78793.1 hypothetical protein GCM10010243_66530 [Streptomyces matensis]AZM64998.1 hypothetical protein DLM49_36485 [Streptomyces sp. WAC 01438]RSM86446.1 hypothetical protein DMA10_36565 [Streptomyces sp. WAC 01420]